VNPRTLDALVSTQTILSGLSDIKPNEEKIILILKESFSKVKFPETISQTIWKVKKSELSNDNFDITSSPKSVPSNFFSNYNIDKELFNIFFFIYVDVDSGCDYIFKNNFVYCLYMVSSTITFYTWN